MPMPDCRSSSDPGANSKSAQASASTAAAACWPPVELQTLAARRLPLGRERERVAAANSQSVEIPQTRHSRTRRLRRPLGWRCGSQGRQVRPEYRLSHSQGKRASRRREIDHARSRSGPARWWGWVARPDTAGVGGKEGSARRGILLSQRPWSPGWLGVSDGVGAGVCGVAAPISCCSRVMPF
jgi:hypothetical protein